MKKQFVIFLVLFFLLGLVPINSSFAITQNQINAEVQIVCPDNYGNWFSGSGTIIDPKGIILTNKHVVTDEYGGIIKTCFVGFVESISQEPNFGTQTNPNLAEVKYYTTTDDMDAAILYLDNPINKIYTHVNIWDSNSDGLKFGDKVEVIGFPGIGGSTITYTSGDFSGFGSESYGTQNYIKTTALLEHGNSGGGSYNLNGQFIGIPTMVITGSLNSISYLLSVNSIKNWLSGIFGVGYQQKVIEQEPVIDNPLTTIQNDVTPPDIKNVEIGSVFHLNCGNINRGFRNSGDDYTICSSHAGLTQSANYESDSILLALGLVKFYYGEGYWDKIENPDIRGIYAYIGTNINAEPSKLSGADFLDVSILARPWVNYASGKLLSPGTYYIIMQAVDKSNNYSDRVIWQYNYFPKTGSSSLAPDVLKIYSDKTKKDLLYSAKNNEFTDLYISSNSFFVEWEHTNISPNDLTYKIKLKGKLSDGAFNENTRSASYECEMDAVTRSLHPDGKCGNVLLENFTSSNNTSFEYLVKNEKYYFFITSTKGQEESVINPFSITFDPSKVQPKESGSAGDSYLISRLKGYILLQVESHGEAWYVNPSDGKRYYMKDGPTAYQMMRNFGLGITNADLAKIPKEGESNRYPALVDRLKGKILLQVQEHGEAWYVNPKTGYRYYMKDGAAAYSLMRYYSLGITNSDLSKIPEGSL